MFRALNCCVDCSGVAEDPEECDDGNTDDGDGCADDCRIERCGDGVLQSDEECDGEEFAAGCV